MEISHLHVLATWISIYAAEVLGGQVSTIMIKAVDVLRGGRSSDTRQLNSQPGMPLEGEDAQCLLYDNIRCDSVKITSNDGLFGMLNIVQITFKLCQQLKWRRDGRSKRSLDQNEANQTSMVFPFSSVCNFSWHFLAKLMSYSKAVTYVDWNGR